MKPRISLETAKAVYEKTSNTLLLGSSNKSNNAFKKAARDRINFMRGLQETVFSFLAVSTPFGKSMEMNQEAVAIFAQSFLSGNCGEIASLGYEFLNFYEGHREIIQVREKNSPCHELIILNLDENTTLNDPMTWNSEVIVLDFWAETCYSLAEGGFRSKVDFARISGVDEIDAKGISFVRILNRSHSLTAVECQYRIGFWRSFKEQMEALEGEDLEDLKKLAAKARLDFRVEYQRCQDTIVDRISTLSTWATFLAPPLKEIKEVPVVNPEVNTSKGIKHDK